MSLVKNLPVQLWQIGEKNRTKKSINENLPKLDKKMYKENQKIIEYRYCQWKNFSTWTGNKKRKTEIDDKRRDLVGIRCCSVFSKVELYAHCL